MYLLLLSAHPRNGWNLFIATDCGYNFDFKLHFLMSRSIFSWGKRLRENKFCFMTFFIWLNIRCHHCQSKELLKCRDSDEMSQFQCKIYLFRWYHHHFWKKMIFSNFAIISTNITYSKAIEFFRAKKITPSTGVFYLTTFWSLENSCWTTRNTRK